MENNNLPAVVDHPEIMTFDKARKIAKDLVTIVKELRWAKNFGGEKDHLEIEAWQFIAAKDGATPSICSTQEILDKEGNLIGFKATAELLRDEEFLSRAEHECTFTESNWQNKPRYSLLSMAQTRAMSKVCRNRYAWIARMGGFSGTPADEMDKEFNKPKDQKKKQTPIFINDEEKEKFKSKVFDYIITLGLQYDTEIVFQKFNNFLTLGMKIRTREGITQEAVDHVLNNLETTFTGFRKSKYWKELKGE